MYASNRRLLLTLLAMLLAELISELVIIVLLLALMTRTYSPFDQQWTRLTCAQGLVLPQTFPGCVPKFADTFTWTY